MSQPVGWFTAAVEGLRRFNPNQRVNLMIPSHVADACGREAIDEWCRIEGVTWTEVRNDSVRHGQLPR